MLTWREFAVVQPDLAEAGRSLLYQHGVGLAFLATVRRDGGPRLHPMCLLLHDGDMFAFIVPSPKQADLVRDGRFAMHSFPCPDNEDAFYLTGSATLTEDGNVRASVSDQFVDERRAFAVPAPSERDLLFYLKLATCLLTRTSGHGDPHPAHTVWHAQR
jgi:Pyridoxamine 5'-phosphate oxidase